MGAMSMMSNRGHPPNVGGEECLRECDRLLGDCQSAGGQLERVSDLRNVSG
jgi:hypothetical protein